MVGYDIDTVAPECVVGFTVRRAVFPLEGDFGLPEYQRASQAVVSVALPVGKLHPAVV